MAFVWDGKAARYRDTETGRYVAEAAVKQGVENVAAQAATNLRELARQYRETNMELATFQKAAMAEIKSAHIAAALAANGGQAAMTQSAWGYVGQIVRQQYAYLQGFVTDVLNGKQPLNGRFDARAASYGAAVRATYENARQRVMAGLFFQYERNVLHANESCGECRDLASRGWVPLGSLPAIGNRQCRSNCRCTITYRERFIVEPLDGAEEEAA